MSDKEIWKARANLYGEYVKTYKDPVLYKKMLTGLTYFQKEFKNKKVVDLCCGTGLSTVFLKDIANVIYIDKSKEMIDKGIRGGTIKGLTIVHDIRNSIPLSDEEIDIAIIRYCIHDFTSEEKISIFREVNRILINKGVFQIIDMYGIDYITKEFYNLVHGWKTLLDNYVKTYIENLQDYENLLIESGFKNFVVDLYKSTVSTEDWLKEQQITLSRLEFIERLTLKYIESYPIIKEFFGIQLPGLNGRIMFNFPVAIITAQKEV